MTVLHAGAAVRANFATNHRNPFGRVSRGAAKAWGRWALMLVVAGLLSGCPDGCDPVDPPPADAVGTIQARAVTGGFELVLVDLEQPLRNIAVDVSIDGAEATRADRAGAFNYNLIEAGLSAPKSVFTVVVADTRRILLENGAVARIDVDGPGRVTLSEGRGVDQTGAAVVLATETAP